ncbi:hypothetical protein LIER_08128 [Lithospermum erythrorhizon]|uniref:Myosin heavy chain n=1 Tax=Lithospermum erythrorhizon TaxID=34254 RepID=A0AAV3PAW0_LITER
MLIWLKFKNTLVLKTSLSGVLCSLRRKFIDVELEKAREDIPMYKQNCADAEEAKSQLLKELDITNTHIEELKLKLEKTHVEEQQAKQESEHEKRRVEELEKGIASEATFSRKAQLEVAKAKHAAALAELKTVQGELEKLQKDFPALAAERDAAIKKAEEAVTKSKEVEKTIEDLSMELTNTKEALEAANVEHVQGEEARAGKAKEIDQEIMNLEKELKEAEEELEKLNKEISAAKELKSKFDAASALLQSLKTEMTTYMESKSNQENVEDYLHFTDLLENMEIKTHNDIQAAIALTKKQIEQLEAYKELRKAMEEAKKAKAEASSMESSLLATQKQIEAAKHFEKLASTATENGDLLDAVEVSLEEYLELSKKAHEAEQAEAKNQRDLEEMNAEIVERKETLQIALQKAEKAKAAKLKAEKELKDIREKQEKKRRKSGHSSLEKIAIKLEAATLRQRSPKAAKAQSESGESFNENPSLDSKTGKKKKKFLPKFFMFMGKKKSSSSKNA